MLLSAAFNKSSPFVVGGVKPVLEILHLFRRHACGRVAVFAQTSQEPENSPGAQRILLQGKHPWGDTEQIQMVCVNI